MNMKTMVGTALVCAAGLMFTAHVHAQKADTKNLTATGTISAIDTKEKTITVAVKEGSAAGKPRTIEVAGNTKIQKNSKINQKLKDLSEGDSVNVMYKKVKEPSADRKSMVEVFKAIQIIVLTSTDTNAPAAGAKP